VTTLANFVELCLVWADLSLDEVGVLESIDPMAITPEQERRIDEMWKKRCRGRWDGMPKRQNAQHANGMGGLRRSGGFFG